MAPLESQDGDPLENEKEISSQKLSPTNVAQKRIYDTKWQSLEKLGYTKPRTFAENKERARIAHAGS